jgi:hypothetical protein
MKGFTLLEQKQRSNHTGEYVNIFAKCDKCGELHYVNKDGLLQVNRHIVHECISCAFRERGC